MEWYYVSKNFCNLRLKPKNLQNFEITGTIYLNSKRSEQFYTLLLEVPIRTNTLGQLKCQLEQIIWIQKPTEPS